MKLLIFIFSLVLITSCSKDSNTFTTPSEYKYSNTKIVSQKVFEVKNGIVSETSQHPFTASLKLLSDSTETIMQSMFVTGQVLSFKFIDNKNLTVKGVDGSMLFESHGNYELNGRKLTFETDILTDFSDDFNELYFCIEASLRKGKFSDDQPFNFSSFDNCSVDDHKISAQNIVSKGQGTSYEHIAIIYLDMVYKKQ